MRDAGRELAQDNQAVSVQKLFFEVPDLLLGCPELREITNNSDNN